MENGKMLPKITYQPKYQENQIDKFQKFVEKKYGIKLDDYWNLHKWSCQNFPEFWECIWRFFEIVCSEPYTEVFDRSRSFENMEWFKGARLNYAENIFKYKDSHVALIASDAMDNDEYLTYRQLYEETCLYAESLRNTGVKKGDVVGCYMSNKKEAIIAFLATASIGAIWSAALPLQGVKAVLSRLQQTCPKILFASGDFFFENKEIKMLEKLKNIVEGLPSLVKVIFVPSNTQDVAEDIKSIPYCCTLEEFLEESRSRYKINPWELKYEQVPFDHPLYINFTSGTTGLPKGIIHSTGAFFVSLKDCGLHRDITRKDVLFNFSPVGWISWNVLVNTLHLGVTLCVYDGRPFQETPTRFWDLIDKFGLTSCGVWSSTAEDMEKHGWIPRNDTISNPHCYQQMLKNTWREIEYKLEILRATNGAHVAIYIEAEKHSLATFRQVVPLGSVMKPNTYEFFPRIIPGIFAHPAYGTTEVFSLICGMNSNLPVYKGEMQCFSLGMDMRCLDERGNEVVGQRGSLVQANPYPGLPISLLNDNDKQMVRKLYLSQYPGYWYVGDEAWINPVTKGFILYGRCDETLNPKGARFNCSEIYFALGNFPGILDSVCVSQYNKERDERVVLFVKMKPGNVLTEEVKREIRKVIEDTLTYEHVPDLIIQVPDIPYNLTGKKLNLVVKKLINKMPVPNADFVVNQESLEFYKKLDLGDF